MNWIIKLLINAAALWVAGALVSGIELEGTFWQILLVALEINAGLRWLSSWITDYLSVDNFWGAILGAIVISIVSAVLGMFVRD